MENKKYELDKVLIDINSNSDTKDNNMSTYIYNYARILEAFITDITNLKNSNGTILEEFDIIDKFKKLAISEVDRCIILNRSDYSISDILNNKDIVVLGNPTNLNESNKNAENIKKTINKNYEKLDNDATKQKVNEPIKPKTIKWSKEDYNNINDFENSKTSLRKYTITHGINKEDMINHGINKEDDPLNDFEFVAEAFARLISKFNKGDI